MEDLARKEAEVRRADTEAREAAFAALLASRPDIITSQSRWADVKPLLADEPAYAGLPGKDDRLRLFRDHVLRLERAEDDARRAAEERERGRQRELRAEFSAALRALVGDGVITVAQGPARGWAALKGHMAAAAAAAAVAAGTEADGAAPAAAPAAAALPAAPPALGWAGESALQLPAVRERLARLAALQSEMLRAASAPPPASVDAELQRLFQGAWDDADRLFHADRRAVRDSLDQGAREAAAAAASRASADPLQPPPPPSSSLQSSLQDSCAPGMSYDAWLARITGGAALPAVVGGAGAGDAAAAGAAAEAPPSLSPPAPPAAAWAARVLAVLAARPWHLRLLHAELEGKAAAAHEAEQRRVAALHDRFEELLMVSQKAYVTHPAALLYCLLPPSHWPTAAGLLLQERPRGRDLGAGRTGAAPPKCLPRRAAACARALVRRVHGTPARQGGGAEGSASRRDSSSRDSSSARCRKGGQPARRGRDGRRAAVAAGGRRTYCCCCRDETGPR